MIKKDTCRFDKSAMGLHRVLRSVALTVAVAVVVAASSRLDIIDLPLGFFPEGITLAEEWTVYVGSFNEGDVIVLEKPSVSKKFVSCFVFHVFSHAILNQTFFFFFFAERGIIPCASKGSGIFSFSF